MADYTQSCSLVVSGNCACIDDGCLASAYPGCLGECNSWHNCVVLFPGYPPPLPNSHYVSQDCVFWNDCSCQCRQVIPLRICICRIYGSCQASGLCYYDCDGGFYWNGLACVPILVPKSYGHDASFIVSGRVQDMRPYLYVAWRKTKRKPHYTHKGNCEPCRKKQELFRKILG